MRKHHVALQGSSRDRPLHFAGRQTELTALAQRLRYICETSDVSGGMVLIDGVQGVGKTQLVNEFARQATFADRAVSWLGLTTHELDASAESLFLRLLAKIGKAAEAGRIADTVGKVTGAAVAGVRISPDSASRQDQTLSQMLQQSADMGLWNRRSLLLTVDEIQNITTDGRRTLRELHEGWHRCPIMVVGAGLQHSLQQLSGTLPRPDGTTDTATISRFAKRLTLAPLGRDETVEAVREGLAALGHDVEEAAVSRLAEASMDFPQHIHGYRRGGRCDPQTRQPRRRNRSARSVVARRRSSRGLLRRPSKRHGQTGTDGQAGSRDGRHGGQVFTLESCIEGAGRVQRRARGIRSSGRDRARRSNQRSVAATIVRHTILSRPHDVPVSQRTAFMTVAITPSVGDSAMGPC